MTTGSPILYSNVQREINRREAESTYKRERRQRGERETKKANFKGEM
jgi:hypothetical protein